MAKSKSQQAFFEILAKERAQACEQQAGEKPGPIVRRYGSEESLERPVHSQSPLPLAGQIATEPRRIGVVLYWIVIAVVAAICIGTLIHLGLKKDGPALPNVPTEPTMEAVSQNLVEQDLVAQTDNTVGNDPSHVESGGDTAIAPSAGATAGKYRLRIARLEVSRSEYTDQLRELMSARGIETDLVARRGYFILYSRSRFAERNDENAVVFLSKVKNTLKEFEEKTGWPAATGPYYVENTVP